MSQNLAHIRRSLNSLTQWRNRCGVKAPPHYRESPAETARREQLDLNPRPRRSTR